MLPPDRMSGNIVRFRSARAKGSARCDQRGLMDAVYAAGSLPVTADDRETKLMAARLHLFGFVAVEEIEPNGTARLMRPSETIHASTTRPWRISRPAFGRNGRIGLAEAGGTMLKA